MAGSSKLRSLLGVQLLEVVWQEATFLQVLCAGPHAFSAGQKVKHGAKDFKGSKQQGSGGSG